MNYGLPVKYPRRKSDEQTLVSQNCDIHPYQLSLALFIKKRVVNVDV